MYITTYISPLGTILLTSDGVCLTGLFFEGQKHIPDTIKSAKSCDDLEIFRLTKKWLDLYFDGVCPSFGIPTVFSHGTYFQKIVWTLLNEIPYGKTVTYGELSKRVAQIMGVGSMSAQAVGGAVGKNPISIVVPCHRVVGANGSLTGYAGGLDIKKKLLDLEKSELS